IWDNEDVHDLGSVETEFPAIVFNETLTSEATLSCEPTISSLNNDEIDFRISFDESDDEDCTPTVSYFNDLDYFNDFENEFPAIVYNDALTSKSDFLTEPTLSPQHIDELLAERQPEMEPLILYRVCLPRLSIRRIQTPWIRRIDLLDVIQSLFFSRIDTAYSYVFDTGPRYKEIDKVDEVSII
ncbi:hypothetical protein Tco_1446011, partial [Tanacetum coccineum]